MIVKGLLCNSVDCGAFVLKDKKFIIINSKYSIIFYAHKRLGKFSIVSDNLFVLDQTIRRG